MNVNGQTGVAGANYFVCLLVHTNTIAMPYVRQARQLVQKVAQADFLLFGHSLSRSGNRGGAEGIHGVV
jgi:hypothetical protein